MADMRLLRILGNPQHEDDISRYLRCSLWSADLPFDESPQRCSVGNMSFTPACKRTKGIFRVMVVPVAALVVKRIRVRRTTHTVVSCT